MEKIRTKITKIGGTLYIIIPTHLKGALNEGDVVDVNINKTSKRIIKVKCNKCKHMFDFTLVGDEDTIECPLCDNVMRLSEVEND